MIVNSHDLVIKTQEHGFYSSLVGETFTMLLQVAMVKRNALYAAYGGMITPQIFILDIYMHQLYKKLVSSLFQYNFWEKLDQEIADIPQAEEDRIVLQFIHKHPLISSFRDDDHAETKTRFNKSELWLILQLFDLPLHIFVPHPGTDKYYKFHREKLLIFTLIKQEHGCTNV